MATICPECGGRNICFDDCPSRAGELYEENEELHDLMNHLQTKFDNLKVKNTAAEKVIYELTITGSIENAIRYAEEYNLRYN